MTLFAAVNRSGTRSVSAIEFDTSSATTMSMPSTSAASAVMRCGCANATAVSAIAISRSARGSCIKWPNSPCDVRARSCVREKTSVPARRRSS